MDTEKRKFLALNEGESYTYFMISLPKSDLNLFKNKIKGLSELTPVAESKERIYYVYSSILKNISPEANYYKQIVTRRDGKLIFNSETASKSDFDSL